MANRIQDLRARYNANGNAIIPNAFQCPNFFVDELMGLLTPEENVVLMFAVRRILGFQDNIMSRKDNISLSQFTDGILAEDGSALSKGCGLGLSAVRNALESLEKFNILIPTTSRPDPKKGQEYWLQSDDKLVDMNGLESRKNERREIEYKRTQKARCSVGQKSSVLSDNTLDFCGTETQNPQKPTETHISGADAPQNLDWQIGMGSTTIVLPDNDTAQRRDAANLIGTGLGINAKAGAELAFAFQDERKMTFTNSEIKGQRKAVKFLLEKKVKPEHVRQAVQKLVAKSFTITDLFSITKDAIDLANQAPAVTSDRPERKIHRAEEDQPGVIDFNEAKRRGLIPG